MTIVTMAQLAAQLHVSVRTVRRYVAAGSIPAKRIGRRVLFDAQVAWDGLPDARAGVGRAPGPRLRALGGVDVAAGLKRYAATFPRALKGGRT